MENDTGLTWRQLKEAVGQIEESELDKEIIMLPEDDNPINSIFCVTKQNETLYTSQNHYHGLLVTKQEIEDEDMDILREINLGLLSLKDSI